MDPFISAQYGYILLIVMGVLWVLLGYYFSKGVKDDEDFMLAGRTVGLAMGTATVMATWVTANTVLVAPEMTYRAGIWGMIAYSGAGLSLILFGPLAIRIKRLMPKGVTSGDFMRSRYGEKTWLYYMFMANVYNFAFMITQAIGGGIILHLIFGIPFHIGAISVILVCVVYTMLGGMRAVVGTDFIQTLLIMGAIVIIVPMAITHIGLANIYGGVLQDMPSRVNILYPLGLMYAFNGTIMAVGEVFHNNLWWVRAHSMREKVVRKGWTLGGIIWMAVPIVAGVTALAAISEGIDIPEIEMIFPLLTSTVIGSVAAILVSIIVLSSLFTSLDSILAGVASLWAEDVYRVKINPGASSHRMTTVNRYIIIILGILTAVVALMRPGTMGEILYFSAAFVVPMIWPIIHGLYSKRATTKAALSSMIIGPIVGMASYIYISPFATAVIAGAVSLIVYFLVMFMDPGDFDWEDLQELSLDKRLEKAEKNERKEAK